MDDTTFHACDSDLKDLITKLENDSLLAIEWFPANCIKLNEEKCHLLFHNTGMNCRGQTSKRVKFAKVKNKNFLELL